MQDNRAIQIGSYVRIKNHALLGKVMRINRHKVLVSVDTLLFDLSHHAIEVVEASILPKAQTTKVQRHYDITSLPEYQLDLHGYNSTQALMVLDRCLDRALLGGFHWLHIIHGQGRGILRKVVRAYLHEHPLVKKVIVAHPIRCMAGVTMVAL